MDPGRAVRVGTVAALFICAILPKQVSLQAPRSHNRGHFSCDKICRDAVVKIFFQTLLTLIVCAHIIKESGATDANEARRTIRWNSPASKKKDFSKS